MAAHAVRSLPGQPRQRANYCQLLAPWLKCGQLSAWNRSEGPGERIPLAPILVSDAILWIPLPLPTCPALGIAHPSCWDNHIDVSWGSLEADSILEDLGVALQRWKIHTTPKTNISLNTCSHMKYCMGASLTLSEANWQSLYFLSVQVQPIFSGGADHYGGLLSGSWTYTSSSIIH